VGLYGRESRTLKTKQMTKQQDELLNSLSTYWQKIVDELVQSMYDTGKVRSGATVQSIGDNKNPVVLTSGGYRITIKMPSHYQYLDQGVIGKKSTYIKSRNSPFKYTTKAPPVSVIKNWMTLMPVAWIPKTPNTRSGKKKSDEQIRTGIAYAIARSIFNKGLEATNFYSDVINDQQLIDFEKRLLDQYSKYVIEVIRLK
jgi:hypothetical protein